MIEHCWNISDKHPATPRSGLRTEIGVANVVSRTDEAYFRKTMS